MKRTPANRLNNFSNKRIANASDQEIRNWIRNLNNRYTGNWGNAPIPNGYNRTAQLNKINRLKTVLANRARSRQAEQKRAAQPHRRAARAVAGAAGSVARGVHRGVNALVKRGHLGPSGLHFGMGVASGTNEEAKIWNRALRGLPPVNANDPFYKSGTYFINTNKLR